MRARSPGRSLTEMAQVTGGKLYLEHGDTHTDAAIAYLRAARMHLHEAQHPRTLARLQATLSSALGARRVDDYRAARKARS